MSKLSLSPNYCSCTVLRARNLPDKGKHGGIDAFCTISMGKEKFATAVVEKTTSPEWREQCDMPIVDDATVKLTVYHHSKNALKGEDFIGRAYVSLRNLQDYDRVHTDWYPLTNREGKNDKNRGEIEVSLQFYSKNDTTGSVLDLATKKKHTSFKDIKHSLSSKINISKHRKDKYAEGNQLAEQRRKLGGDDGSSHLGQDFLEESPSETTSYTGSHISLNSMSYNNNADQHKKKNHISNLGTPHSSHRSVTSDYETSSILDSASMYGADETSNSSQQISQHEVNVDEQINAKEKKKKSKAPKLTDSPKLTERNRSSTVTSDATKSKDHETNFGLTTINENLDLDESYSRQHTDDEIDLSGYFDGVKKPTKRTAPILSPSSKQTLNPPRSDDIQTPSTSISVQQNVFASIKTSDHQNDSTDEDVDELLGKLERMSSMRSSKRRIQPVTDESSENGNKFFGGRDRSQTGGLPDIVVDPKLTKSPKTPKKSENKPLDVLGIKNVKSTPIHPHIRQELEYLDREELLHVISYQNDVIKKRDTRLRDLEQYTDCLLVKIVEQCPTILQVGNQARKR